MGGLLIPPWYKQDPPSELSVTLITFMFGFSTACAIFCMAAIIHQVQRTWKRSKRLLTHPYILLICSEWVSSVTIAIIGFLFLQGIIPPRYVYARKI